MGFLGNVWNNFHVKTFVSACRFGDESQVNLMLKDEPELAYSKDKTGVTALFHAASNNHYNIVETLLNISNQVNDVEPEKGWTPLHIASADGYSTMVNILIKHGAKPNIKTYEGSTALHWAVSENQEEIVSLLLNANADPGVSDKLGQSAFDLAKMNGNQKIIKLLT